MSWHNQWSWHPHQDAGPMLFEVPSHQNDELNKPLFFIKYCIQSQILCYSNTNRVRHPWMSMSLVVIISIPETEPGDCLEKKKELSLSSDSMFMKKAHLHHPPQPWFTLCFLCFWKQFWESEIGFSNSFFSFCLTIFHTLIKCQVKLQSLELKFHPFGDQFPQFGLVHLPSSQFLVLLVSFLHLPQSVLSF